MNVKRTYTVTDHNDDFITCVRVEDVKGLNRDFPMDYVEEVLVSYVEDDPYVEVTVKFFLGQLKDTSFVLDAESLKVLEYELKKFRGKDLFFYKHKPTKLSHEKPEVTLPTAMVVDSYLMVFTSTGMRKIRVSSIQSIVTGEKEVSIIYYDAGEVAYMPFRAECYPSIVNALKEYAESLKKGSK